MPGQIQGMDASQIPGVRGLDFSGLQGMRDMDFSQLQGMRDMDLSGLPSVTGLDLSKLPSAGINPGETYTDAAMRFYEPIFKRQQEGQQQTLANQGIGIGAEAYSAAGRDLADQQDRARLQAVMTGMDKNLAFRNQGLTEQQAQMQGQLAQRQQGLGEQQALTGYDLARRQQGMGEQQALSSYDLARRQQGMGEQQALQQGSLLQNQSALQQQQAQQQAALQAAQANLGLRQAGINEQQQMRSLPLNELNAILTGQQVQNPQFPNVIPAQSGQAPNLLGALQGQYGAQLNQTNAQNAQSGNAQSGLVGLGSAALMAMAMSDRRLKTDIEPIGKLANGLPVYKYRFIDEPVFHMNPDAWHVGVMADEAELVVPDAVATHSSGYKMVNYSMLGV
jgi:hypothetical protein